MVVYLNSSQTPPRLHWRVWQSTELFVRMQGQKEISPSLDMVEREKSEGVPRADRNGRGSRVLAHVLDGVVRQGIVKVAVGCVNRVERILQKVRRWVRQTRRTHINIRLALLVIIRSREFYEPHESQRSRGGEGKRPSFLVSKSGRTISTPFGRS